MPMKTYPNYNKRKYPRAIFCIEEDVATCENSFIGFSHDITPEGIFIETNENMTIGQEVSVLFLMPESLYQINKDCRVVSVLSDGAGLEFSSPVECFLI